MVGTFLKGTALALALAAAYIQEAHAVVQVMEHGCRSLNRDINFEDSLPGPYTDDDLQADFDGYRYFKRRDMASIADMDGTKYLDVRLHDGCVGTVGDKGCGLQGALPLFGMGESATLEYTVRFGEGYNFKLGGKLMGLCSGDCKSGCHRSADQGFSARIMWGPEGSLYLYTYTFSGSTRTCGMNTKPSVPVRLEPGVDYTIRLVVRMNNPEDENGVASLYVNGEHIVTAEGLKMRTSPEQVVDSMVFHTFFGGSGEKWAATRDEHIFFKSIKIWDGDCGGSGGALNLQLAPKWEPEAHEGPEGTRKLAVSTDIYGSWNGRFCLWYEVTNDGSDACNRFMLETNVNPTVGSAMASYKNLRVVDSDEGRGWFMFTREQDKHAFLKPGKTRKGNICLESPRNIKQSYQRIDENYHFDAFCAE